MLKDEQIEYLKLVEQELVHLWVAPGRQVLKYVFHSFESKDTNPEIDQKIAAQVKAMGLTRVNPSFSGFRNTPVELTERGKRILEDERESGLVD